MEPVPEPVAAAPAEAAPAEAPAGQPAAPAVAKARAKRGESGLPEHVRPVKNKDGEVICYMARLRWLPAEATAKKYDFIQGTFATPTVAAEAQAKAQVMLTSAGPEAVWPDGLPGRHKQRQKRDAAFWQAELAAREEKAAAKAATKAAREAAEAARPKRPRKEKPCQSTALPRDAAEVRNPGMRAFLQPLADGNAAAVQPPQCTPIPVAPGLDAMQANDHHTRCFSTPPTCGALRSAV